MCGLMVTFSPGERKSFRSPHGGHLTRGAEESGGDGGGVSPPPSHVEGSSSSSSSPPVQSLAQVLAVNIKKEV